MFSDTVQPKRRKSPTTIFINAHLLPYSSLIDPTNDAVRKVAILEKNEEAAATVCGAAIKYF